MPKECPGYLYKWYRNQWVLFWEERWSVIDWERIKALGLYWIDNISQRYIGEI